MDKVDKFRQVWSLTKKQLQQTNTTAEERSDMEYMMMVVEEYLQKYIEDFEIFSTLSIFHFDDKNDNISRAFTFKKDATKHQVIITPDLDISYASERIPTSLLVSIHRVLMLIMDTIYSDGEL